MDSPSVTVVVPTRDRRDWLDEALQGVWAQTRQDFVVVVCDNASTDGTADYLAGLTDPRLTVLTHPVNVGLVGNVNAGLAAARTPYVALLLDDDGWTPTYLERVVPVMEAHPRVLIAHTAFRVVRGDGSEAMPYSDWREPVKGVTGTRPGRELITDMLAGFNPVMVSSLMMRTDALTPDSWSERDVQAEDMGALMRLALDGDVAFVAEPLAVFRMHASQVSTSAGHFLGDKSVAGFEQVAQWAAAKERFLDDEGSRLGQVEHWRRVVRAKRRKDAVWSMSHLLEDQGSLRDLADLVRQARVHVPDVLREPRLLKLAGRVALRQVRRS